MINIRLPNITGKTDAEQLSQIKSYLYQFAEQLQWALSTVETSSNTGSGTSAGKTTSGSASKKEDPVSTFNQLKGLIIKSADIVNAYYEKIDNLLKLSGYYMAQSDFGKFTAYTDNKVSASDAQIRQDLVSKQSIYDENGNIKAELLVNGHIFSGIIEYAKDGEAIVGIEIGQTTKEDGVETFNKFARFTASKLSFYDANSIEVAYISDYKMVITEAWVKGNLTLGSGFVLDTSNGIALRPI